MRHYAAAETTSSWLSDCDVLTFMKQIIYVFRNNLRVNFLEDHSNGNDDDHNNNNNYYY